MQIEVVKSREQLRARTIGLLLYQLSNAAPDEAANISKELRKWYKKRPTLE